MAVPHLVIAAGWIPFLIDVIMILFFAISYIRYYQNRYESEVCTTLSSIAGLAVILMVCALLPVDIFLVSSMKTPGGVFKDWAADKETRESIQNAVLYTYYVLYAIVLVFVFLLLPFSYFFYEEGDEHERTPVRTRICTGLKYTSVFVVLILVLLLIGGLVPFCQLNSCNNSTAANDTWDVELRNLVGDLQKNGWKDAISFSISFLTMFGFALVVFYTSAGMAIWPLVFIRGVRSPLQEREEVINARKRVQEQIDKLRSRYRRGERLSQRDQRTRDRLEDEEQLLSRQERHLAIAERSCEKRCARCLWPLLVVVGCTLFVAAVLILLTLVLTNVDKLLHSCGPRCGYILPDAHLPNPIDILLVLAQTVFPVDYLLVVVLLAFLFFSTMEGLQSLGVWCLCVRMYRVRPRRTYPQGLLMLCFILMLAVLGMNILVFQLAPQYTTYGSQRYAVNVTYGNITETISKPCSTSAPRDDCLMSQMSSLLLKFCLKFWFFGAAYFWMSWGIIVMFVLSFVVCLARRRRSSIEGEVSRDDLDSDEDEAAARA